MLTDIYCITAEEYSQGRSNIEVVESMLAAEVEIIQYRDKKKSKAEKYQQLLQIRELTKEAEASLIVNDHVDLALAVEAEGVHVGQDDLPVEVVRELVGPEMIIGLSTHSPTEAQEAQQKGVDYIGVGPIFATDTKEDVCAPVGFEYLEYVVENIELPFVAIGGIKEHNIKQVQQRGAECMALVTEILEAEDIIEKIKDLRALLS
ncbi:thiamine phosphate synthase [Fuchsiella alkaliacetigena]|uniref:thiamine phosphate synthase n=1 Tax=Fuchsiella alkaliacetigena TaxID=957042 RepID=UPI002009E038|nr:thiamine phosphate synthase [Fuchsiella alkaliacetigena]MCK8826035.1 thiamine phosphate synthase [Fuchsiella alkaliacetigena]